MRSLRSRQWATYFFGLSGSSGPSQSTIKTLSPPFTDFSEIICVLSFESSCFPSSIDINEVRDLSWDGRGMLVISFLEISCCYKFLEEGFWHKFELSAECRRE